VDRLEAVHDFIQWLFPLPEPSPVNPLAPVLDPATIAEFRKRSDLTTALLRSFETMLAFYGFRLVETPQVRVDPSALFAQASENWLTTGNHNHLRITRILRSTRVLGLETHSEAFFRALSEVYETPGGRHAVGEVSFRYWRSAVFDEG
jgi:hypothetical protein